MTICESAHRCKYALPTVQAARRISDLCCHHWITNGVMTSVELLYGWHLNIDTVAFTALVPQCLMVIWLHCQFFLRSVFMCTNRD
ncbi:hypothetical protein GDO78_011674 [Eleutherodactylus coqui]|uniref:Uncharacterized protein n=1 Tax=Eleutherodactylus coqui TaxID=57060 RepID=A0A8J6F3A1_ELECQ|nr:hypothetical protein GDO78_011674 [Eleutherodactylus coqui]